MMIEIKAHPALTREEIDRTRTLYKELRSIHKVSKILHHSPVTIEKYASDLISEDRRSCYHDNTIGQYDPITLKCLCKYNSISCASKVTKISRSNICKAVKGHTKTAGGYIWRYLDEIKDEHDIENHGKYFVSESKRIDRILDL